MVRPQITSSSIRSMKSGSRFTASLILPTMNLLETGSLQSIDPFSTTRPTQYICDGRRQVVVTSLRPHVNSCLGGRVLDGSQVLLTRKTSFANAFKACRNHRVTFTGPVGVMRAISFYDRQIFI